MASLFPPIITLTSLILCALVFIVVIIIFFFTSVQDAHLPTRMRDFYESLRAAPCLSPDATLTERCRHACHRAYFRYLITGPGYTLEPAERIVFDGFVIVLLDATAWCVPLLCSLGVGLVQARWLNEMERCVVRVVRDEVLRWMGGSTSGWV